MKALNFKAILLCSVLAMAPVLFSCSSDDDDDEKTAPAYAPGTVERPYTPTEAINAVSSLTWTSNTEFDSTDEVYVKGIISRVTNNGYYSDTGIFGNASFYISDDGSENNEFYCFRVLYLGNKKYTEGRDIQVGDEVVICGKLTNYKGNTPETVTGQAYLYSLKLGGSKAK